MIHPLRRTNPRSTFDLIFLWSKDSPEYNGLKTPDDHQNNFIYLLVPIKNWWDYSNYNDLFYVLTWLGPQWSLLSLSIFLHSQLDIHHTSLQFWGDNLFFSLPAYQNSPILGFLTRYLVIHYFWMYLWGCFWIRWDFFQNRILPSNYKAALHF